MEAEERPSKIRKLGSNDDHEETAASNVQTLSATSESIVDAGNEHLTTVPGNNDDAEPNNNSHHQTNETSIEKLQQMSKNQLKKVRRKAAWEAGRPYRKAKRKEKTQAKKARKKAEREEQTQIKQDNVGEDQGVPQTSRRRRPIRLPVTIVIDCGFDDLMVDKERISLGSQLTRSYSDVHKAPCQAHLYISSWSGLLKERFDTVLSGNYRNWKGIVFTEDDFVGAAEQARQAMQGSRGGKLVAAFEKYATKATEEFVTEDEIRRIENGTSAPKVNGSQHQSKTSDTIADTDIITLEPEDSPDTSARDIVYLTSESPYTLTSLSPNHIYIVGGLVDKNRHKGICYKTACDRGIRTAKLPIGEYMEMTSRFVLATNHVVEIMLKWLELGDWAQAFMQVVPKRKGGKLRNTEQEESIENGDSEQQNHEIDTASEIENDDVAEIIVSDEDIKTIKVKEIA